MHFLLAPDHVGYNTSRQVVYRPSGGPGWLLSVWAMKMVHLCSATSVAVRFEKMYDGTSKCDQYSWPKSDLSIRQRYIVTTVRAILSVECRSSFVGPNGIGFEKSKALRCEANLD